MRTSAYEHEILQHCAFLLSFAVASAPSLAQPPAIRFPVVHGRDLNGTERSLPSDFVGPVSLAFVAFEQRQQSDVDSWKPFVARMRVRFPSLGSYELPTIGRGYSIMRPVIDGGMRSAIHDESIRASTITLYIDVSGFAKSLGIESKKAIAILVVRPSGEVLAMRHGAFSPDAATDLEAALAVARE